MLCDIAIDLGGKKELWLDRRIGLVDILKRHKLPSARKVGTFCEGNTGAFVCFGGESKSWIKQMLVESACYALTRKKLHCELWYGLVGVLHSLMVAERRFLQKDEDMRKSLVSLFDVCMLRGRSNEAKKKELNLPLYYEWHGKCYFGLVHGIAGIVPMCLQVFENYLTEEEKRERKKDKVKCK